LEELDRVRARLRVAYYHHGPAPETALHIPHRTKPCTSGAKSKSPANPNANSKREGEPSPKSDEKYRNDGEVANTEYVCRRSLSAALRPYPG
jgi:hypothetical protein